MTSYKVLMKSSSASVYLLIAYHREWLQALRENCIVLNYLLLLIYQWV